MGDANCSCSELESCLGLLADGDIESPLTDEQNAQLRNSKIVLLALLGPLTLLCSLAPWGLQLIFKRGIMDIVHCCSATAAGIIFGAFLSHMVPDTAATFTSYFEHMEEAAGEEGHGGHEHGTIQTYPWNMLIIGASYILLMFVDRVIVTRGIEGVHDHHSHDHISAALDALQAKVEERSAHTHDTKHVHHSADQANAIKPMDASDAVLSKELVKSAGQEASAIVVLSSSAVQMPDATTVGQSSPTQTTPLAVVDSDSHALKHKHTSGVTCSVQAEFDRREAVTRAWVFLVAMSLHAVFDGLSIGGQQNFDEFYGVLVAVIAHKVFDGLAVGAAVYPAQFSRKQSMLMITFCALMTPLGIAIGLGAVEAVDDNNGKELAKAIIVSLSAGSFLFISLSELLPSALHDGRKVALKLSCFFLGWLALVILAGYV